MITQNLRPLTRPRVLYPSASMACNSSEVLGTGFSQRRCPALLPSCDRCQFLYFFRDGRRPLSPWTAPQADVFVTDPLNNPSYGQEVFQERLYSPRAFGPKQATLPCPLEAESSFYPRWEAPQRLMRLRAKIQLRSTMNLPSNFHRSHLRGYDHALKVENLAIVKDEG